MEESLLFNIQYSLGLFTDFNVSKKISAISALCDFPWSRGTGAIHT